MLRGGANDGGADTVMGGSGADSITGGPGDDRLDGQAGTTSSTAAGERTVQRAARTPTA